MYQVNVLQEKNKETPCLVGTHCSLAVPEDQIVRNAVTCPGKQHASSCTVLFLKPTKDRSYTDFFFTVSPYILIH
jgi:hypothetical protein